jgi:cell division protein FtsB
VLRQPNNSRRSKLRQSVVVVFCLGLMAYFGHHAVHGRHGLEARTRLIERSSLLAFEARSLEAVRAKLERDVALLSPSKPHPDLIEEVARDVLGFVKADDVVIVRAQL